MLLYTNIAAPSPFRLILSRAVNEAVQTMLGNEQVNKQENNLIIGFLSAHMNGQKPGKYSLYNSQMLLMINRVWQLKKLCLLEHLVIDCIPT